jgi:hypothetical protein
MGSIAEPGTLPAQSRRVKARTPLIVGGLALFSIPVSAPACEPVALLVKEIGVPHVLIISLVIVGLLVVLKSAAFARFQNKLSLPKALLWMFAATVFTSIVGLLVPAMVESGGLVFVAVPVVWALCWLPAQRVILGAPLSRLAKYTPGQLAFAITAVLVMSYLLFVMSRSVGDSAGFGLYWIVKFPVINIALIIAIAVAAFWEEWILWRFSKSVEDDVSFVRPVVRANLVVLAVVALIASAVMIPKRLRSPDLVVRAHSQVSSQPPQSPQPPPAPQK